ncbi:hypothetical protein Bbelb_287600 [Branchiostoma belcheri]|nr:hypothetical protein Bbelb_287600 [Branchiostoma belcheri]
MQHRSMPHWNAVCRLAEASPIILRKLTKARKATTDVTPTTVRRRVKEVETARKITSRGDTALQLTKELQRLPREDLQAALKAVKLDKIRIPAANCSIKHFLAKYRELFPTSSVSIKMHLLEEHVIPRGGTGPCRFQSDQPINQLHPGCGKTAQVHTGNPSATGASRETGWCACTKEKKEKCTNVVI